MLAVARDYVTHDEVKTCDIDFGHCSPTDRTQKVYKEILDFRGKAGLGRLEFNPGLYLTAKNALEWKEDATD